MDHILNKYTKKHLKVVQNGQPIFNCNVWVCLERTNYCNVESPYFLSTDHNRRMLKFKLSETDTELSYISLGFGDTVMVTAPK